MTLKEYNRITELCYRGRRQCQERNGTEDQHTLRTLLNEFMELFRMKPWDLAVLLDVSDAVVVGWIDGHRMPRKVIRKHIYKTLQIYTTEMYSANNA